MYGYNTFHPELASTLIDNARSGRVSQAYIFEGSRGMYKMENARLFANALVCENSIAAPCGSCRSCIEAKAMTHPDIVLVTHDTGEDGKPKKTIGVAGIRRVNESVTERPRGSRKVYIIPDGENMTVEAQNAFLKTLEEPPEYAVFIIVIPSASQLLQTIISRSTVITFNQVPRGLIRKYIMEKYPEKEDMADFLAVYCEGVPGAVDDIAGNEAFEDMRNSALAQLPNLISQNPADAFEVQKYIEENKDSAKDIIDIWISFLRDIFVIHCGAAEAVINSDRVQTLTGLCARIDMKRCLKGVKLLTECEEMLAKYVKTSAAVLRCALLL